MPVVEPIYGQSGWDDWGGPVTLIVNSVETAPARLTVLENAAKRRFVNTEASAYTITADDYGLTIETLSNSPVIVTVDSSDNLEAPEYAFVRLTQVGTGQVTVTAASGVTLRSPAGTATRARYSTVEIRNRGGDEWVLSGDLSA